MLSHKFWLMKNSSPMMWKTMSANVCSIFIRADKYGGDEVFPVRYQEYNSLALWDPSLAPYGVIYPLRVKKVL